MNDDAPGFDDYSFLSDLFDSSGRQTIDSFQLCVIWSWPNRACDRNYLLFSDLARLVIRIHRHQPIWNGNEYSFSRRRTDPKTGNMTLPQILRGYVNGFWNFFYLEPG